MRTGHGRPDPYHEHSHEPVGTVVLADAKTSFVVTAHCVDRFWERAASGCARFADALARLELITSQVGTLVDPPPWLTGVEADAIVALGPDVVLVVKRKSAVTCLARGGISEAARAARNARRGRRPVGGRRNERGRPIPDDDSGPELDDRDRE
jgi:hypothetical protein